MIIFSSIFTKDLMIKRGHQKKEHICWIQLSVSIFVSCTMPGAASWIASCKRGSDQYSAWNALLKKKKKGQLISTIHEVLFQTCSIFALRPGKCILFDIFNLWFFHCMCSVPAFQNITNFSIECLKVVTCFVLIQISIAGYVYGRVFVCFLTGLNCFKA